MLSSGVPPLNTLRLLEEELAEEDLADAVAEVAGAVEAGEDLCSAIGGRGDAFGAEVAAALAAAGGEIDVVAFEVADRLDRGG